jgi:preprotein translocase subunit SecF
MADDNRNGSYLGIPVSIWLAIILAIQTSVNTWMQQRNHAALEATQAQQAAQHDEVKSELNGIKVAAKNTVTAVKENTSETAQVKTATQAIPAAAAVAAEKIVEQKAEAKAEPPGIHCE